MVMVKLVPADIADITGAAVITGTVQVGDPVKLPLSVRGRKKISELAVTADVFTV